MIRVLLVSPDPEVQGQVAQQLAGQFTLVGAAPEPETLLRYLATGGEADVVVVANGPELAWLRELALPTVVLLVEADLAAARAAWRAGAAEVLAYPAELAALGEAVRQAATVRAAPTREAPGPLGRVVGWYSAKGGAGVTLLAANLGVLLAKQGHRTLLVDLNLATGGVEPVLGLRPERQVADLWPVLGELSLAHVKQVVSQHASGLAVLSGPRQPSVAERLQPEGFASLLRQLRCWYDWILLDLPAVLTAAAQAALLEAQGLVYVATPDAAALWSLQGAVAGLKRLGPEQVALVMNRASPKAELGGQEFARLSGLPLLGEVRSAYWANQGRLNLGQPVGGGLARDLGRLAERLVGGIHGG